MKEQMLPPNSGFDVEHPELLYQFEDLPEAGGSTIYPDVIECHNTDCQNQYLNTRTYNCCSVYGLDHTRKNSVLKEMDLSLTAAQIALQIAIPSFPPLELS